MSSWPRALALILLIAIPVLIAGLKMRGARRAIEGLVEKELQGQEEPKSESPGRTVTDSNPSRPGFLRKARRSRKEGAISGRIADPEGYLVPTSSVRLLSHGARSGEERVVAEAETDGDGRFRFAGLSPGITVWIAVKAPHYHECRTGEVKSPRTALELPVILLEPFGMIEGMVVDSFGSPVPKAAATLNSVDSKTGEKRALAQATTDEGGYYQFLDIPPQEPVWIEIAEPDYLTYGSEVFRSPRTKLVVPFIVLNPLGVIQGIVVDPEGYPLSGVSIHVYDEFHTFRHTRMPETDEHGRFSVAGLATRSYGIRVMVGSTILRSLSGILVEEGTVRDDLVIPVKLPEGEKPYDPQTLAVYRAEHEVKGGRRGFDNLEEIVKWVDEIVASGWFRANFPRIRSIEVKTGAGRAVAYASRYSWHETDNIHGYISLPEWARQKIVIVHEIGHVCCDRGGHGPDYTGIYLALVERFIDRATMEELASKFVETGALVSEFQAVAEP
jgi:putative metallohydrolase (TIGR04338 family)